MPHTIEHTWDNRCALISDDAIKGVNSVNEEFLQRMRGSIRSFYNSSLIAREAFAKEALNGVCELVVAVAGHHMPGAGDIHIAGMGHKLQKILGVLLTDQFGGRAAHQ